MQKEISTREERITELETQLATLDKTRTHLEVGSHNVTNWESYSVGHVKNFDPHYDCFTESRNILTIIIGITLDSNGHD